MKCTWINLIAMSLVLLSMVVVAHADQTRALTVMVQLRDPDGGPVAGCEVNIRSSLDPMEQDEYAETDAAGVATATLVVNDNESLVLVGFSPGGAAGVSHGVISARRERFWELLSQYALPGLTQYPIAQGQTELNITINLKPGITVQGRAVDSAEQAIDRVGIFARNHPWWGKQLGDGMFEIIGIEKGAAAEIFVMSGVVTLPIRLDAQQTAADVNLGDVQVPPKEGDAVARITIDHEGWRPVFLEATMQGVSLISEDGQRIYSFMANQQGQALTTYMTGSRLLPLPPGTYYLVPGGTFTPNRPLHLAALDLVRSGQAANVQGWPKLVAVSGQNDEITINAAAVDQVIMQAAGKEK